VTELIARWLTKNLLLVDVLFDNERNNADDAPESAPEADSPTLETSLEAAHIRGTVFTLELLNQLSEIFSFRLL